VHIVLFSNRSAFEPSLSFEPPTYQFTRVQGLLAELPVRVLAYRPDLVLIGGFENTDALLEKIETLSAALPKAAIVLIAASPEPAFLLRAMRAGVREVIASDAQAAVDGAVARLQARQHGPQTSQARAGRCLGVMPAKGGDGSTCVVANLAAEIAKNPGLRVLVIDLSLPFGDVELFLTNAPAAHDLADFSDEIERLDGALLEVMAQHLAPNFHLIQTPQTLEPLLHVTPACVERLIRIALEHYDHVLIDLGLDAISLHVLGLPDLLDQLVLVTTANVPSVRRASQIIRLWESLEQPTSSLALVINRHTSGSDLSHSDIEKTLGLRASRVLPQDIDTLQDSLLRGVPAVTLKPRSDFAKSIAAWVADLTGQRLPETSIWTRLGIK
jgi:pilus assembly protein CpaE